MRETPKPFEVYRHFKGNMYQILTIAADSETRKPCVVYQALYGEYKVYVRDLAMFLSETDSTKYPDASQMYRFEKVTPQAEAETQPEMVPQAGTETQPEMVPQAEAGTQPEMVSQPETETQPEAAPQQELDPGVLEYLDAESVDARLNILTSLHNRITDEMINTLAVVTDVEINEGPVEVRYQELKNCLQMKQKFEKQRY
ncbi:MAG: DUF1653 domain-containing protein [Lachnospiraceae bacterium]|nr:DUF1653 domain-containing protein [Lachnospiraceae bacterium]